MPESAPHRPRSSGPSLADLVASHLRGRILSGEFQDGSFLPTQKDLLAQFGVSRPTLREALRILEAEGLIRVLRGKLGGSIITAPSPATAAYAIATVLEANRVGLPDVAVALQEIEPACLAMAARRPDRKQAVVSVLRSLNERSAAAIDDPDEYRALAHQLHRGFISSSGSQTMELLACALEDLWMSQARASTSAVTHKIRCAHVDAHTEIIDAVDRGDSDLVQELARRHLREATTHSLTANNDVSIDSSTLSPGLTSNTWSLRRALPAPG